ncbi:MAG: ABC transporter permease [Eubacteriales bacterium]|nr:ABC transporter permease [Eubacteriales bacterium]
MNTLSQKRAPQFNLKDWGLVILLVLLIVFFTIGSPNFLNFSNIRNILLQNAHVAIVSMAVAIIMISGGTDLSIGYQMALASVVSAKMMMSGVPFPVAILAALVITVICSTLNELFSLVLKGHTMIITLGTMSAYQGLAYIISNAQNFHNLPDSFLLLGQGRIAGVIPVNIIIMVVLFIITAVVLGCTHAGKKLYAVGDNPEAARLAGINVPRVKLVAFALAGVLTGIAAMVLTARTGNATATTGSGLEFTGITAAVLGGVSLKGGEGKLWRVIVAAYILGILSNGMQLIGLGTYPQYIAKGVVMLISIGLGNGVFSFRSRKKSK